VKITKSRLEKVIAEEVQRFLQREMRGWGKDMRSQALGHAYKDFKAQKGADEEDEEERARKQKDFRKAHTAQAASKKGLPDWMIEEEQLDEYESIIVTKNGYKGYGRYLVDDEGNEKYLGPAVSGDSDDQWSGTGGYNRARRSGYRRGGYGSRRRYEESDDLERPASRREHLGDAITDALVLALEEFLKPYDLDPGVEYDIMLDAEEGLLDVGIAVSQAIGTHTNFGADEMMEGVKAKKKSK
jgi:hypothetical protein